MHLSGQFAVTLAGHVQNMKPGQNANCTAFIFCTFNAVVFSLRRGLGNFKVLDPLYAKEYFI